MPGSGGTHRGQHLHRADAQRTTHEAAEGRGSQDCAAAAGADHHRSHSSVQRRDPLHHCLCRLRHLLRLRRAAARAAEPPPEPPEPSEQPEQPELLGRIGP
ncbi:unnamed protein product, partial [Closterium sp. NIES-53]